MSNKFRGLAVVLFAAATAVPVPAHAASLCLENIQFAFTPALDVSTRIGQVTVSYQTTCADLPGFSPSYYSGSYTAPYFGSCAVVVIDDFNDEAVIAGGTVYSFVRGGVASAYVVQANAPCPIASAHGSGVIVAAP